MFFSANASDANPNPMSTPSSEEWAAGWCLGRPGDTFGLGFARTQFSTAFVPFLRQRLALGLEHEDAFEAYYNAAITAWLSATADLQVVNPGLQKALSSSAHEC